MAFLVQNSQGRFQLILFTGNEIQPLVYLPADFHPVSYRQRPPADPSFLSLSPDGRWACLYGDGQPGEGVPLILVDCERGSSNFLIWPLERNALPAHLRWSPNSRRLAISSDLFDGSGSSLVVDLPLKKMEWFDDLTFWLDSSWLLLYHSSPPGAEYAPPLAARLYNVEYGQNHTLDLSGYSFIWDVMSK